MSYHLQMQLLRVYVFIANKRLRNIKSLFSLPWYSIDQNTLMKCEKKDRGRENCEFIK